MFIQPIYNESSPEALLDFIDQNPLGIFTTGIPSDAHAHLQSSHIPWVLDRPSASSPNGPPHPAVLRGHLARANPQAKSMVDSLTSSNLLSGSELESEVMIIFNGPYHHYVPPKFYTESVSASSKVAGTWNYAAVQVYGKAKIYHDVKREETDEFLMKQLYALSDNSERKIMGFTGENGRDEPWNIDDVPRGYLNILKKAIVGIEITVDRIEGKFKMSQEKSKGDREGVARGLEGVGSDAAKHIARSVREFGERKQAAKMK
ncbi:transcriptional regulator PAI 2-type [Aspergillus karnatakaensis]|uniref:FMN-binding negative transcriptional regulator n=1 Tax=Aspergillus karnatakaensis TaxID=1810916 RepID=UPI003CCE4972